MMDTTHTLDAFVVFPFGWNVYSDLVPVIGLHMRPSKRDKYHGENKLAPVYINSRARRYKNEGSLTRCSDGFALLGRLEVLFESVCEGWFRETRCTPSL